VHVTHDVTRKARLAGSPNLTLTLTLASVL